MGGVDFTDPYLYVVGLHSTEECHKNWLTTKKRFRPTHKVYHLQQGFATGEIWEFQDENESIWKVTPPMMSEHGCQKKRPENKNDISTRRRQNKNDVRT